MITKASITSDLRKLGIIPGDLLLVHSSYKAIGNPSLTPDDIIQSLLDCVGATGTLFMPALSYMQQPAHIHSNRHTPSNVGVIPERFRTTYARIRSLHPTHSVCGLGPNAQRMLCDHFLDRTPCGVHSPFRKLLFENAKILMLGCGLKPNTSMHAIEEIIGTPYLFGNERTYSICDANGTVYDAVYRDHGFRGWEQMYDRIAAHLSPQACVIGTVGKATCHVLSTEPLLSTALLALRSDRLAFVSKGAV